MDSEENSSRSISLCILEIEKLLLQFKHYIYNFYIYNLVGKHQSLMLSIFKE